MECSQCQFENPAEMRFCGKCGARLEKRCPQCQFSNPPQFAFCGKCGHPFGDTPPSSPKDIPFDEKIEKIQRYLPKGLTEKILAQRDRIEGERKQVTVMFCDMEGFTALTEKLGPEEAYAVMDQVYEILIHKVHDYEGTVNEMTGDGIMALFGAPIALEDAPQRALRSSLAIHRAMAKFNEKLKQEGRNLPSLKMRIGIHTGPVVVGTLGNDLRVEFKAVGDTVNLASRMEGLAEPGSTFITKDTCKLTEGLFRFEALGAKQVKGKKQPINVYQVIAASSRRTRFDVSAERGLTPFIGRQNEIELLLDGFERARNSNGQVVSIVSEAGVGKSRLLYEFRKEVANENVTFIEGKCLSYSKGVVYHPLIDVLKSYFEIRDTDSGSEIITKVQKGLKTLALDEVSTLPYLLELLSVKDSGIENITLSPEAKKDRTIEAIKRVVLKCSEIQPLILIIEDLHWIDNNSQESLKELLNNISGARILLLLTFRPEFVQTWGIKSYHHQVNLNRLARRESSSMVAHLLGTEQIDRALEDIILDKTEGVPFFIEEFLKALSDLKLIVRRDNTFTLSSDIKALTIPSTIQDVIMARVDSLPDGAKLVLQAGAAIEREFNYYLIKAVTGFPETELLSHLNILKDSELLYERGVYPQSTFIFKHALTQEVVYNSILHKKKKRIHEAVGDSLVELHKENIENHYGVIADHYVLGESYVKGADYSKLAGSAAQKKYAYTDGIRYAKKRVFSYERLPDSEVNQINVIDARTRLALYFININRHVEARAAVGPIVDIAIGINYQEKLPAIFTVLGTFCIMFEEAYSEGFGYLEKAISIAGEVGDYYTLWLSRYFLGWHLSWDCDFERGICNLKKCLETSISAKNIHGETVVNSSMSVSAYLFKGDIDIGFETTQTSLKISKDSGDIFLKGLSYTANGIANLFKGTLNEAQNSLLKGSVFCEKADLNSWRAFAFGFLGNFYHHDGKYEKAEACFQKAIAGLKSFQICQSWAYLWELLIVRARILNGQPVDYNNLIRSYDNVKVKILEGWVARLIGDILLRVENQGTARAEEWIKTAIDADKRNGTRWNLGMDYALYAEFFKRNGDFSRAREQLGKAIDIFKGCGADGWVEKYEKELASLQ